MLHVHPIALGERRDGLQAIQRLGVFRLVGFAVERVIAVEHDARAGGPEQEASVRQLEVDLRRLVDRRRHLRGQETPPDELVELEEVFVEILANVFRRAHGVGGTHGFMSFLRILLRFVIVRLFRKIV